MMTFKAAAKPAETSHSVQVGYRGWHHGGWGGGAAIGAGLLAGAVIGSAIAAPNYYGGYAPYPSYGYGGYRYASSPYYGYGGYYPVHAYRPYYGGYGYSYAPRPLYRRDRKSTRLNSSHQI